MFYEFPKIEHINDVLPYIDDNFIVADKGEYTVISYILPDKITFPEVTDLRSAIRRECRGIIFCNETGEILRRVFNKFFNCGEREDYSDDVITSHMMNHSHSVLEKLDGSMVSPFVAHSGKLIWGTKMGETHISPKVQEFVSKRDEYIKFARICNGLNLTPIFEWYSPEDRIVVDYGKQEQFWLTAVRDTVTGEYYTHDNLLEITQTLHIPVVGRHHISMSQIKEHQESNTSDEGYVIRFDNGHMVKVKFEHYCKVHKAKSSLTKERHIVDLILNEKIDDLKSFLEPEDILRIEEFEASLHSRINEMVFDIQANLLVNYYSKIDKKTLALKYKDMTPPWLMSALFKFHGEDGSNTYIYKQFVVDLILKNCNKDIKYKESCIDNLLQDVVRWKPIMFDNEEN